MRTTPGPPGTPEHGSAHGRPPGRGGTDRVGTGRAAAVPGRPGPSAAPAGPIAAPTATPAGQCAPLRSRRAPTSTAAAPQAAPTAGRAGATATKNATAAVVCPDGPCWKHLGRCRRGHPGGSGPAAPSAPGGGHRHGGRPPQLGVLGRLLHTGPRPRQPVRPPGDQPSGQTPVACAHGTHRPPRPAHAPPPSRATGTARGARTSCGYPVRRPAYTGHEPLRRNAAVTPRCAAGSSRRRSGGRAGGCPRAGSRGPRRGASAVRPPDRVRGPRGRTARTRRAARWCRAPRGR